MWIKSLMSRRTGRSLQYTVALVAAAIVGASCSDDNGPTDTVTEGSIQVQVATTGSDLDPDGYTVLVDGADGQAVGLDGSVTFADLAEGNHQVSIEGLAANCSVTGDNPLTVSVTAGQVTQAAFDVVCAALVGDLTISTSTSGGDIDPDGFQYTIDGGTAQAIGVNETITVELSAGDHSIELGDVAANCTVEGDNPRTVTVPADGTTSTEFVVTCDALTGSLVATTSTTGVDLDPDGYTVSVDGGTGLAVDTNGSVTFSDVEAGDRSVELSGVAANCSVTGDNPVTVTVPSSGEASHTFDISCTAIVGSLEVTTATTGSDIDPDGYSVSIDGELATAIGIDETVTVDNVSAGDRMVELTGVASNCSVSGENPRTVTVIEGDTVATAFDVTCEAQLSNEIVFDTDRDGNKEIYVMSPDGSGLQRLTTNAARDAEPFVSPDGTKIAFVSDRSGDNEIWVMDADGGNPVQLTFDAGSDTEPAWSPDGTQIVFSSDRNGDSEVFVMNADGSGQTALTSEIGRDGLAQFSPDGSKIVFTSERDGDLDIWVMNADGSSPTQLTNAAGLDFAPAYSPDGSQIAFTSERDGNREIYLMNADGSSEVNLSNNAAADLAPQWSPDGSQIAFASNRDGNNEVYVMTSSGSGQTNITNNAANDFEVSWSN